MSATLRGNKGTFHFSMDIAAIIGIEAAVFLDNICFWVRTNAANKINFHEGRYWTYNKLDAFVEMFPCWTRRQIERIINNLIKDGYLLTGNFNNNAYDRTKWYTLSDSGLKLFNISYETPSKPISPNGEMKIPERGNENHQTVTAIPDTKPYTKPDIKNSCSSGDERPDDDEKLSRYIPISKDLQKNVPIVDKPKLILTMAEKQEMIDRKLNGEFMIESPPTPGKENWFDLFWEVYPKKQAKKAAMKAWQKAKLDTKAADIIMDVQIRIKEDAAWQNKMYIPNPATYLNGERWNDEITPLTNQSKNNGQSSQHIKQSPSATGSQILEAGFRKYFGDAMLKR